MFWKTNDIRLTNISTYPRSWFCFSRISTILSLKVQATTKTSASVVRQFRSYSTLLIECRVLRLIHLDEIREYLRLSQSLSTDYEGRLRKCDSVWRNYSSISPTTETASASAPVASSW